MAKKVKFHSEKSNICKNLQLLTLNILSLLTGTVITD